MRRIALIVLVALPVMVSLPGPALAEPIRIGLTLTTRPSIGNPADIFGVPLLPGSVFTGVFTYDSADPDRNPDPTAGSFRGGGSLSLGAGSGLQLAISSLVITDRTRTFDLFTAFGTPAFPGFHPGGQTILHFVSPSSAVDNDALPQTAADFAAAFGAGFLFIGANRIGGVGGGFDSFTHEFGASVEAHATVVPEPASMILLGTGLLGVARVARRRRAQGTGAGTH